MNTRSVFRIISILLAAFLFARSAEFPYQLAAAPITMGETNVLPGTDSGNGNLLIAQSTGLAQPGTLQSLSFYVRTAAGNLRLGIYDATGASGGPGALKAQTNSFAPVAGWNTQPVVTPVSLPAGTYWLVYLPSSNSLTFAEGGGGQYRYAAFAFGAMPAAYPAVAVSGTTHWSLYATLDTSTTPDTTAPTVSISAPAQGATVSGTIAVNATASDNVSVAGVQFKLDGANLGAEGTVSPYSANWNTTITTNGTHTLTAIARDASGNTATSTAVNVTVSNTPPAFPIYRASGTFTSGTGAITPPYPATTSAGDVCFLVVESENQAITLSSAQGFAEVPTFSPQSAGTAASNPASRLALFWRRAVGGDAAPTVADSGDHTTGQIHCFRNVVSSGIPWDTGAGGNDSGANDTSGTIPGGTTSSSNTLLILFTSTSFNGTSTAQCSAWTNAGLANLTERADNTNTAGLGGGHCMATGEKASAGAYGATALTLANTSFKGAISLALKSGQSVFDTTPPSQPTNLSAVPASSTQINISWTASTDDLAVAGYNVTRNGAIVATTAATTFADTGLTPSTLYTYTVRAFDTSNNYSAFSASVGATTPAAPADTTPPSASMTAPASGTTISGVVTVSANATDNVGVHDVEFLVDGVTVSDDTTAPYSFNWDTTTTSNGLHTLSARAHDGAGNFGLTSGVVTVTVNNQPSQLPPDLVAAWPFTESTGLTTADVTNYGNTAMFDSVSEPIWTVGKYGSGIQFDGTNTSFLTVIDSPTMNVTGTALTLSMWINPSSGQVGDGVVIGKSWGGGGPHYQYGIELSSTRVPSFYIGTTNNTLVGASMGSALPVGQWSHLAVAYDGSLARFYLNGAPVSSPSMTGNIADRSGSVIRIGADVDGSQGFKGSLDDVRLYKRVENPTDIVADMNTPVVGNGTGTGPSVAITSPALNAQVSNIVTVVASASDAVGVQFFVDGTSIGVEDTAEPYAVNWDTRAFPSGAHTLTARARDGAGAVTVSNPVTVNVANTDTFQNEILSTNFAFPIAVKFLSDGRMLVAELGGKIWINPAPYTTPDPTPFLTVPNIATGDIQLGIFDFALDPNFTTNRYVYVSYASDIGRDRLSRFTIDPSYAGMVPGSELIIYQDPINIPSDEHHGGAIAFSNDGKIFFTTGEHFQGTPSQDLTSPWGKVHRFNMDGSVPTDNPFYDGTGPHWDSVYALGLRNPFRAYYDAPTGRLLVGDVGGNGSTSWEEVNLIKPGANYGWPDCENGTCGNPAFTAPVYAYPHDAPGGSSITGGFVYHGSQFPVGMLGSYFFADYARNYIKRLTFDQNGNVSGVFNFEPPSGVIDGPYGDIVYLTEGPDGALYYLDLGYSDTSGTYGVSKLRRIRYQSANQAPSAVATADKTSGPTPLTANFSSAGSSDPEGQPITYSWDFGDGSTLSTAPNPSHTFIASGVFTVRLTVSDGVNSTFSPPISVSVGSAPTGTINSPVDGAMFLGGDVISFSGTATDPDDGVLSTGAFTWNIDFLHDGHVHPGPVFNGVENGTFTIPVTGHDFSGTTRYHFTLTVTDSNGLKDTKAVTIWPQKVNLTFDTVPSGITLYLDGVAKTTPFVYDTLINFQHSIDARNTTLGTTPYNFASWSDGGTQSHTIIVPASAQGYVATYSVGTSTVTSNFGETTVLGGTDSGNGNLLLVQSATLPQPGSLQSLSFYVRTASGQLRLGIYDATGASGGPGALLAQTNAFAPATGWNTANVIAPVSLPAGNYWLAYFPSSNSLTFAEGGGGAYRYANVTFGTMPATFPAIGGSGTAHWALYGTVAQ
jgi:glucose/arabinose dehydrogenase/PKD repeat protein/chitodextrinase